MLLQIWVTFFQRTAFQWAHLVRLACCAPWQVLGSLGVEPGGDHIEGRCRVRPVQMKVVGRADDPTVGGLSMDGKGVDEMIEHPVGLGTCRLGVAEPPSYLAPAARLRSRAGHAGGVAACVPADDERPVRGAEHVL